MSRDIRSFFSVAPKKNGPKTSTPAPKKPPVLPVSDDEDIITDSPVVQKKEVKRNNRKPNLFDSDSDTEKDKPSSTSKKTKPKKELKPVNVKDIFGDEPVKQSYVEKKKSKKDEDFEKTLQQLDDDLSMDIDELDRTIDEAIRESKTPNKTQNSTLYRKRKAETDLNESGLDPDQERFEKRRNSALLYKQYLNRSGPVNKGLKELPKGDPSCLKNLCFLRTGVLDSLDGDDFKNLVEEHGGRIVHAVSKKVNYVVVGLDAGPAKLAKAQSYGIKEISEDDLLDMILEKSGMKARYVKHEEIETPQSKKEEIDKKSPKIKEEAKSPKSKEERKSPRVKEEVKVSKKNDSLKTSKSPKGEFVKNEVKIKSEPRSPIKKKEIKNEPEFTNINKHPKLSQTEDLKPIERVKIEITNDNKSWTEKYKPTDIKSIIGQQGDSSNMKKLMKWLKNWYQNHSGKNKPKLIKPSPWAKNDDGSYYKCALLSGPPGVGKTTTATLVAKELGFDVVEFNASDTRSKKLLHEEVSQLLSTKSIATFFKDGSAPTMKHVLLMDEVDGMAGNEDRGGIQELIGLIKNTNVPIICMCNDRQHQKMRSLVNHCFDLRFIKPRIEQIRGALMSICYKEGIDINPETLSEVIKGAGMDIRQSLNNLSMWTASDKKLTSAVAEKESNSSKKDTIIGPWEVIRKVFSEEEHKTMSIIDKSKLFFYDYSIGPLFVQENYLQVVPHCEKKDILSRVAKTADSISMGDLIDKKIRSTNNWSLLESQAMFSSVFPGHYMEGHFAGQINFPGWLGKNSKRTKFQRLTSELQAHMRTSISGSKQAVNLDYIYHLRSRIVNPLRDEGTNGVSKALEVMQAYNLLREDMDSILELALWPKKKDPMALVDSKVKAAFTRAYNKEGPVLPYAINSATFKKKTVSKESEMYGDEEGEESEENEDDDITKDAMIKAKKPAASSSSKGKKQTGETSKKAPSKAKVKKPK